MIAAHAPPRSLWNLTSLTVMLSLCLVSHHHHYSRFSYMRVLLILLCLLSPSFFLFSFSSCDWITMSFRREEETDNRSDKDGGSQIAPVNSPTPNGGKPRAANPEETIDDYDGVAFVVEPSGPLLCRIHSGVMKDPVIAKCGVRNPGHSRN